VLLGIVWLVFRVWITEFKLKEKLSYKRRFLSRTALYAYPLVLLVDYHFNPFNFAILLAFPVSFVSIFTFDVCFFLEILKEKNLRKDGFWSLLERLTLHIPPVIQTIVWIINSRHFDYEFSLIFDFFIAGGILYALFFAFDARNPFGEKKEPPYGWLVLISIPISAIGFGLILN